MILLKNWIWVQAVLIFYAHLLNQSYSVTPFGNEHLTEWFAVNLFDNLLTSYERL